MKPLADSYESNGQCRLMPFASWPGLRVLSWHGPSLYVSRGYTLLRCEPEDSKTSWSVVGRYTPEWWRRLSSSTRLTSRLCRDGFHFLTVLPSGHIAAAVPGAIVTLSPGDDEFKITHRVLRGTRPLSIAATPDGGLFWGEYFQNQERDEVCVYGSRDEGASWDVVHTFPRGAVRHVHSIVYDQWGDSLWILTGDFGEECKIIQASCDWKNVDLILSGNQQARAVAMMPAPDALYFASDTPLEANYVYRIERSGKLERLAPLDGPSYYCCRVGSSLFFSTAAEPSEVNSNRDVYLYGSSDCQRWPLMLNWRKDFWPMTLFQYGTAILPAGNNTSSLLALTCVGVDDSDLRTTLWRVSALACDVG